MSAAKGLGAAAAAAPLLARRDKVTGHLQKKEYGGWMIHVLRLLARFKLLRGTAFDPLGYTAKRKAEQRLIAAVVMERPAMRQFLSNPAVLETPSRVTGCTLEQMSRYSDDSNRTASFLFCDASSGRTPQPSGRIPPTFVRFCARLSTDLRCATRIRVNLQIQIAIRLFSSDKFFSTGA